MDNANVQSFNSRLRQECFRGSWSCLWRMHSAKSGPSATL
ncbi:TPA: hypothetical protein RG707_001989 [Serratia liquefaciens]|nr:hypothetical protein [Serratia liquefaciens]